jgi:hypothetical protein
LLFEYAEYIVTGCLPNKEIDLVLYNKGLNIFDNIGKSINFLIIVFLEYPESIMFFLEFRFLISTKVRVDNNVTIATAKRITVVRGVTTVSGTPLDWKYRRGLCLRFYRVSQGVLDLEV